MAAPGTFVDYSGAMPILVPMSIRQHWHGIFLPAPPDERSADLVFPEGAFNICDAFDFKNPKTDYDRACALGPAVQEIAVGPGKGLVLPTELDPLTWWADKLMLVNGGSLPDLGKLANVRWADECVWQSSETHYVLMNACDHGAAPLREDSFEIVFTLGKYVVQRGEYGWAGNDPALVLYRFVQAG